MFHQTFPGHYFRGRCYSVAGPLLVVIIMKLLSIRFQLSTFANSVRACEKENKKEGYLFKI